MANIRKRSQRDYQDKGRGISKLCLLGKHKPADHWVLRPALVGAGVVIGQVHFDRPCLRCMSMADRLWSPLVSPAPLVAQDEPLPLQAWLDRQVDVRIVEIPEGEVRAPDTTAVAAIIDEATFTP